VSLPLALEPQLNAGQGAAIAAVAADVLVAP
jgi:hypothetical protein